MHAVLTPVVEFEPASFSTREHPRPTVSGREDPAGWDRYWRASLADAGLVDLPLFRSGSWFVAAEDLTDAHVLDALLSVMGSEGWSILPGGHALSVGSLHLLPGCCGDLSNLNDWRRASEQVSAEWKMLWIGHPWTHVSAQQDVLTFLRPSEQDPPGDLDVFGSVSREALGVAIERASLVVDAFAERLRPRIAAMDPSTRVEDVLEILLGGPFTS
jgi:hypothetical protein